MSEGAAKGIAQGIATLTAAGVGAAVGGAYGAATAATVDANNRQLHPSEKRLAEDLAKKSGGKYTAEQIEEQMRLMGNKAFNEAANKTEVLTTQEAIANNLAQDPSMPKASDGKTIVEVRGQADADLQQYIIGNSTSGADYIPGQSPYVSSNAALNAPSTTGTPNNTTPTARCANGDLACISGVGAQQSSIPELTQAASSSIADGAALVSRQAGVIAAGATATAASGPPQVKPIAGAVTLGATAIAVGADVVEQVMRPNTGQAVTNGASLIVQTAVEHTPVGRVAAPITNEMLEMWKSSGSSLSIQEWLNTRLQGTKP